MLHGEQEGTSMRDKDQTMKSIVYRNKRRKGYMSRFKDVKGGRLAPRFEESRKISKPFTLQVKMSEELRDDMDIYCKAMNISRSDLTRYCIAWTLMDLGVNVTTLVDRSDMDELMRNISQDLKDQQKQNTKLINRMAVIRSLL